MPPQPNEKTLRKRVEEIMNKDLAMMPEKAAERVDALLSLITADREAHEQAIAEGAKHLHFDDETRPVPKYLEHAEKGWLRYEEGWNMCRASALSATRKITEAFYGYSNQPRKM